MDPQIAARLRDVASASSSVASRVDGCPVARMTRWESPVDHRRLIGVWLTPKADAIGICLITIDSRVRPNNGGVEPVRRAVDGSACLYENGTVLHRRGLPRVRSIQRELPFHSRQAPSDPYQAHPR